MITLLFFNTRSLCVYMCVCMRAIVYVCVCVCAYLCVCVRTYVFFEPTTSALFSDCLAEGWITPKQRTKYPIPDWQNNEYAFLHILHHTGTYYHLLPFISSYKFDFSGYYMSVMFLRVLCKKPVPDARSVGRSILIYSIILCIYL